jgi:HK97 family phage major capsid protein
MEIKALKPGSQAHRGFAVERSAVNVEARTVELAFSSEAPYERYWGIEILDHSPKSMRAGRLKSGGALLMDHDTRDQVGVIESVRIDADKVARAVVRFGKSARAEEVFADVADGIRRNVSVGYVIHEAVLEREVDGVGTYRVTDWEPFEVSFVAVPADAGVGVGRSADADVAKPDSIPATPKGRTMSDTPNAQDGIAQERARVSEIIKIGEAYKLQDLASAAARDGSSVDQFRAKAMEALAAAPKPTSDVGLTEKEAQRFSVVRLVRALANPQDMNAREAAAFEFEASQAARDKSGKTQFRGHATIPSDVLKRDLNVGTASAGGNSVSTDLLGGSFIEMLRNRLVFMNMGATMLTGLVGNIAIPRQTGGASSYWVAEGGASTESQATIDQVTMGPKTVAGFTDATRRLLMQSSLDVEAFMQRDLVLAVQHALQQAGINGAGSATEPRGILNVVGIGTLTGTTNGATLNDANIVGLETEVAVDNADIGNLAYLTNARVRGKAKTTYVDAGSGIKLWSAGNTPLNGYGSYVTNAVPSNVTKGSGVNLSPIIFGNWADFIIGLWGGLDIMVNPYALADSGGVRVHVFQDCDMAVRHAESFAADSFITA